jgi:hypothetical protein
MIRQVSILVVVTIALCMSPPQLQQITAKRERDVGQDLDPKAGLNMMEFQARVQDRKQAIKADLAAGVRHSWEGSFSNGPSFFPKGWMISKQSGYVSIGKKIDMGTVQDHGDHITLHSNSPW